MDFLVVLVIVAGVVLFVSAPLRRLRAAGDDGQTSAVRELEAARESKYREIRDAELDHTTGKLSDADYAEVDGALRAEAIDILRAIDRTQSPPS